MNKFTASSGILLLAISFLTLLCTAQAQDEKPKFGKPSMADLKMTRYDSDTSAEAVILSDIGSTWFDYDKDKGFIMHFDRFERIKILTKDGYSWADQSIRLYRSNSDHEIVITLKAITFNLADKKVVETKMDNSAVFDEIVDLNWTLKKFTLPAVREGSVIDIHYEIQSPYYFNLQSWGFQNVIPERYSEYEVRIPEYFHYKKQVSGYHPFCTNEVTLNNISKTIQDGYIDNSTSVTSSPHLSTWDLSYNENVGKLAAKDVPAMKGEMYTSSLINYHSRVEYELESYQFPHSALHDLTSTWDKIVHEILTDEDFGGQLKKTGIVKDVARDIKAKSADPLERMVLAYDYVRTNVKWNNNCSKYPTTNVRSSFSDRKGNSADVNMILILLLKELGINADPVLLSTRANGMVRESVPNFSKLNYVIACADIAGKKHLLDATDIDRPYTMLPFRCMNSKGILAIDDSVQWLDLLGSEKDNSRYYGEFRFTPAGEIQGKLNISWEGYPAFDNREALREKGNDQFMKDLRDKIKNATLDSIKIEDNDLTSPVKLSYNLQSQELVQSTGNMLYFNPLLEMGLSDNPFTREKREYPVDFGCPHKTSFIFLIDIPEGYAVESLPQNVMLALPDNAGTFKYNVAQAGSKIAVNCILSLSKTLFVMPEYPDLREFYTRIVAKEAEKIVLKKG
jgi:transglutaminase-like putative cysteine protease